MSLLPFAYHKGKIVPLEQATISIASHSLQYGSTCYAGIRGYIHEGKVVLFRLKDHHKRLMNAMKIMGWDYQISFAEFRQIIEDLIEKNKPESDFYIRPFVYSEDQTLQLDYKALSFDLALYMLPLGRLYPEDRGVRAKISHWKKFSGDALPMQAKAGGCYINSCLALSEVKAQGYDEAIMANQEGYIVEASAANILIVRNGEILTPPLANGALDGITLRSVVEILKEEGYVVTSAPIDKTMLYTCDELIIMGTAAEITFAESIDDKPISESPGPICTLLRARMKRILSGKDQTKSIWRTVK